MPEKPGSDLSSLEQRREAGKFTAKDWRWRRAGVAEYAAVAIGIAGTLVLENEYGNPSRANWTARNGLDESVRGLLRLENRKARNASHEVSDALMALMIAAPVVDTFATLGYRDRNWDTMWQTSMVNVESFAFTGLVSSVMQNLIKREKPFARNCVDGRCEAGEPNRSMPSGHVAFAFTGAGLLCTNQEYLALHENPATARAYCATGIGLGVVTGLARIMADRHYFTDVAAGTVIGLFSGFVLPRLLHYSHPAPAPRVEKGEDSLVKELTLTPRLFQGGAGLACDVRF